MSYVAFLFRLILGLRNASPCLQLECLVNFQLTFVGGSVVCSEGSGHSPSISWAAVPLGDSEKKSSINYQMEKRWYSGLIHQRFLGFRFARYRLMWVERPQVVWGLHQSKPKKNVYHISDSTAISFLVLMTKNRQHRAKKLQYPQKCPRNHLVNLSHDSSHDLRKVGPLSIVKFGIDTMWPCLWMFTHVSLMGNSRKSSSISPITVSLSLQSKHKRPRLSFHLKKPVSWSLHHWSWMSARAFLLNCATVDGNVAQQVTTLHNRLLQLCAIKNHELKDVLSPVVKLDTSY